MVFHLVDGVRASGVEMIYEMNFVRYVIQEIHALMILIRILSIAFPILTTLHTPHTRLTHELAEYIHTPSWNRHAFYNNDEDDDEDYTTAIIPDLPITESYKMEDKHLDTILEKETDEFIKFSVENLIPNSSESEDECECDVPGCDDSQTINFSTEFNPIHNEDLDSTPRNDHFDTKSYLLESLLNRDTLMALSSKFDSLLEEFFGELAHTDLIPPGINEANCDPEEDIHLVKRLFDPFLEEIDLFLASDGSIPPGIDSDYSDSEGDNLFPERFLHNDPNPLPDIFDFSNVVRVFLPFLTCPMTSLILLSSGSEDIIFDPGISNYHFSSLEPVVSHWSGTFMKLNVYRNHLYESSMEILSSTCFLMDQ
nr:hypothetical protein [Tanacetum cinerariifolium]